jgi:hypothetical protein
VSHEPEPTVRCSPRRVRAARAAAGLTRAALLGRVRPAGVGEKAFARVLNGSRVPVSQARAVAEALGVPIEALLGPTGPPDPE